MEAIVQFGTRVIDRAERLLRAALIAAKHEQLGGIVFWAALIGICGAFTGVAFRASVRLVQRLLTGSSAGLVETAELLPWWARIAVPTIGGVCAGSLLWAGDRVLRPGRRVDYMEAVAVGNGQLSGAAALVQAASAFFTIGSGGSIGREGPLVQLAATAASKIGQWTQAPVPRLRLLVACGAAAGIAAAYNAPIAGALFVAEVVLGSIAMESFGPLIVASVVSDATTRHFLGYGPVYQVPHINFGAPWELALYALLGVMLGHGAAPYLALLDRARSLFARLHWPLPATLALGGLMVGVISVGVPQVWGNGYSVVNDMLNDKLALQALALALAAKLISTAASVGSGANGGILTPTLFMGAAFGALFADVLHLIDPHLTSQVAAYAVVGMGAFLAATTHAPLTSILLIFEMTLDYEVVLPLMLACVTGHYVAGIYRRGESVYSRALRASGPGDEHEWRLRQITALVRPPGLVLQRDAGLGGVLERLSPRGDYSVYVVDPQNQLVGQVAARDLRRAARATPPDPQLTVGSLMQPAPPMLVPEMLLGDALDVFMAHRCKQLPVVSGHWSPVLLGEVLRHDLLLALQDRMSERDEPAAT
ncbi:MAG TPA: ClcB-like voltage-gated chloride channel protein [Steroidobacteraceae bacterium]